MSVNCVNQQQLEILREIVNSWECENFDWSSHILISTSQMERRFIIFKTTIRQFSNLGRIHLVYLRIRKYFMDDSSVNFHDKFFLHFLVNFSKKWRKNLSWKFTDESSIKYLWIRKWTRWIWPLSFCRLFLPLFLFDIVKRINSQRWLEFCVQYSCLGHHFPLAAPSACVY